MLTIPAISSGIRVFCGRKWQAAITGRNDVQQKQGVRNQNYLQRFMFFPFIRIYNKMYKVYLTIVPICTDFQNYIPIDTGECLCEISWEHFSL